MCTPTPAGTMIPYGLKIPSPYFSFGPGSGGGGGVTQGQLAALDFQRSQLHDYNVRVQLGLRNYQNSLGLSPFHTYITDPYAHAYFYKHDPRARFVQEEPKPSHSYIGLIGMAILQSKDKKLVLSDIYQWILDNYAYFRSRGPGWRNSIRHNLSLNDCFIKSGRSANGKGHYWAVHPANVDDFERGDFRRRRAQRKVRRHMGLAVPDDDDSPSPSPTQPWMHHDHLASSSGDKSSSSPNGKEHGDLVDMNTIREMTSHNQEAMRLLLPPQHHHHHPHHHNHHSPHPTPAFGLAGLGVKKPSRKRLFDMASLLAPDEEDGDEPSPDKIRSLSSPQTTPSSTVCFGQDALVKHRNEKSDDGEKYSHKESVVVSGDHEQNNILYDDDDNFCDNDYDDEDNCEEIHVTSDDESCDRLNPSKCFSDADSNLSVQGGAKSIEGNCSIIHRQLTNENNEQSSSNQLLTNEKDESQRSNKQEADQLQSQHENKPSTPHSEGNVHDLVSQNSNITTSSSTTILKQSQHIVQNATTMKAFYEFMSDKLRDQSNHIFHPLDRPLAINAHLNIPHHAQIPNNKDTMGDVKRQDTLLTSPNEHTKIPNLPKDDNSGSNLNPDQPSQKQPANPSPISPTNNNSNSLRNDHHHRSLQSIIAKEFPRENNFSAFESLGFRGNPSLFTPTAGNIHPGMLRAMGPFAGGPTILSQGSIARPGIPTSCLQMLQATPAVSVPAMPAMSSQTPSGAILENSKR